ncbi:DUF7093 family protein [Halovivax gelatinilyticus]|uniref:DUF7093 family protein n=1 Tax=Halovivax gelatinilyticus TaxID=2961597 RepID=UPI0020CA3F71|nr:hypothetical protein [Halovivax gelatinilyticus]
MAVRCSLLGHSFGELEVDRTREERGSEVVVTVEEYEVCDRCGTRNVLSENTEVKRIARATDSADSTRDQEVEPPAEREAEPEGAEDLAPSDADDESLPTDEAGEPITDDAEILDDSDGDHDEPERGHGEWPASDDVGADESDANDSSPAEWPDAGEPEPEDTGELIDDSDAPQSDDAATDPAEPTDDSVRTDETPATRSDPSSGIESAGDAPEPGTSPSRDGVPTEFFCPRCSFVASSDRGSLRAGDICPECKKGYLGERERR